MTHSCPRGKALNNGMTLFLNLYFYFYYIIRSKKTYIKRGSQFHPFYDAPDSEIGFPLLKFLIYIYRKLAIITRGFYFFNPILEDHFFVFKEFFSENSVLMYG